MGNAIGDTLRRSSRSELLQAADALRALALPLSSGAGLRQALLDWPGLVSTGDAAPVVSEVARWVELGAPIDGVAAVLDDRGGVGRKLAEPLRAASRAAGRGASVVVSILEGAANELSDRATRTGVADALSAGVRLSGRMVAVLPVAFLWLVPAALRGGIDLLDVATFMTGGALIVLGARWISRCQPAPGVAPAPASLREAAALVKAGMPPSEALTVAARHTPWEALHRSASRHHLGLSWGDALRTDADSNAARLASIWKSAWLAPEPAVGGLERMAAELVEAEEQAFEKRARRAPVLMVLPLVFCILPGFAIVTLGPFIRRLLA